MTWQKTEHNWIIPFLFLQGKNIFLVKPPRDIPDAQPNLGEAWR